MEKIRKSLFLIIILTLISYSVLTLFSVSSYAQSISSDVNTLNNSTYPGIKDRINALKSKYPNWNFKILYTDLNWSDVIANEYVGHTSGPRSMIEAVGDRQGAWICPACTYKYGNWRCASQEAIAYMMDPRNSLNASDVFQFEELTTNTATISSIAPSVAGTFLKGHETEIINSANATGINAYYIVARLIQEQSASGSVLSNGSRGYYNPFNIQATGNTDAEVISTGIAHAQSQGWNTLEKGIVGGINFLSSEYIKQGQNTLYLQKFDVENKYNGLYWHQYMQNLMAAQSEGAKLRSTYESLNAVSSSHTFVIPVYKNMPASACNRPNGSSAAALSGDIVKLNVNSSICLRNAPNGTVIGSLYKDEIVTRLEKATSRVANTYWDKVQKSDGTVGYVARETYTDETTYKLYLVPVSTSNNNNTTSNSTAKVKIDKTNNVITVTPDAIANDILTAFGGPTKITRADKSFLNGPQDSMCTGFIVEDKYTVVKKGDVNGDGKLDISDLLALQKHLLGVSNLSGTTKGAGADVISDGKLDISDLLKIQKCLLGVSSITI